MLKLFNNDIEISFQEEESFEKGHPRGLARFMEMVSRLGAKFLGGMDERKICQYDEREERGKKE